VNASWTGETIQTHAEVHLGVAVSLAEASSPRRAKRDRKHVVEISREVKDLAARRGRRSSSPRSSWVDLHRLEPRMFDVTEFTAIIKPPESCILAVGAVRKVPVVKGRRAGSVGHR